MTEEMLTNLIAFSGQNRDNCLHALEAAHGDPNMAFELLATGAPIPRP